MSAQRPGGLADGLAALPETRVERNLSLAPLTTYQVGGPADWAVFPRTPEALAAAVALLREHGLPIQVLGRGSNVLIGDGGLRGVLLVLRELEGVERLEHRLRVGAGADCTAAAAAALEAGLTGIEFFHYLPGSVGGAAFMNARAFEQEMSHVWRSALVVTAEGSLAERRFAQGDFAYKSSPLQTSRELVARLDLELAPGAPDESHARMRANEEKRRANRELDYPSCGCVFKNDHAFGAPSGHLIDRCGLKGFTIGGAQVSAHHANFVINLGHATAADLRAVIEHVRRVVHEQTGHLMEPEVRFVGEF
ncbi:MAG: UDP-N-acetylmuramate dehydrogenase [bacterium]